MAVSRRQEPGRNRSACASPGGWPPRCSTTSRPTCSPGVTTGKLNDLCHDLHGQACRAPCPRRSTMRRPGYKPFPKSICTSVNHQVCHGIPGERVLKAGDILNIDVTVIKDGFHGDSQPHVLRRRAEHPGAPPGRRHLRMHVARHRAGAARRAARRHRRGDPGARREARLLGRARILRPRHRPQVPRGAAGAALRQGRHRPASSSRA